MKICSLLPSATEILYLIGAGDNVVGVTHECDFPPEARSKPIVVKSLISHDAHNSREVDRMVREALRNQQSLYTVDVERIATLAPEIIITQDLCEVCAIDQRQILRAFAHLPSKPEIVSLHPHTLEDVLQNILRVGGATGHTVQATAVVTQLRQRIAAVRRQVAQATSVPRVVCLEWLEPLMNAGHWVPEMVKLAGGIEPLSRIGEPSVRITWEDVMRVEPQILVLMPCGFSIERATRELDVLTRRPGWSDVPAVRDGRVYLTDASAYYNRSGPRLVEGLEILAELIHPELCHHLIPAGAVKALTEIASA